MEQLSFDIVQKAVLLESNALLGHQKGGAEVKPTTIREVISFYTQMRTSFAFGINYETATEDLSYDQITRLDKSIYDWAKENNILMFRHRAQYTNYFVSEEDATAFKLRWV